MENALVMSPIELRVYIEFLRHDLLEKGTKLGISNKDTVKISQELDYFIFQYQLMEEKTKRRNGKSKASLGKI